MKRLWGVALCVTVMALSACAAWLQPQAHVAQPWVPLHELPEPGERSPLGRH